MTQTAIKTEVPPTAPGAPRIQRLKNYLWRALTGATIGGLVGFFLIEVRIFGTAPTVVGAVLGLYLTFAIWGAVVGAAFGFFFINGVSATVAGLVVGAMISCKMIGRKGRWLVLVIVMVVVIVDLIGSPTSRARLYSWFGY